jgi:hypothetical protein
MPMTRPTHRHAHALPRFGETLRCPYCWHFVGVGVLSDGRTLRCTACGHEVMLAHEYDAFRRESRWELHPLGAESYEEFQDEGRR